MPILIILAVIAIAALLIASYGFMKYVFIAFIALGLMLDFIDFIFRMIKCLKRDKVPSAVPVLGFLLVAIGLLGFAVRATVTWKQFLLLLPLALIVHLTIQLLFPLVFTVLCNLYYKRKLFDFSPLPKIKGNSCTK